MTNDQLIDLVKRINTELYPRGEDAIYGELSFISNHWYDYISIGDVVLWDVNDPEPVDSVEDIEKLVRARLFDLGSFWAKATTNKVSLDPSISRWPVITDNGLYHICGKHGEPVNSPEYCGGPSLYAAQEVRDIYEGLIARGVLVYAKDIKP